MYKTLTTKHSHTQLCFCTCRDYDVRDAVLPMGAVDGPSTMMSFKAFLAAQDDSITVDDSIQKYNEYKLEFRRQQLNEFFVAHKDEEWYASFYFITTISFK